MNRLLKKMITRLWVTIFPNKNDREAKRWWADGGDEKLRFDYDLNGDSLVLDLGGYKGQWASDIYARYNCRVFVFEPVRSFAEKIEERFRRNPRVRVFRLALGANRRQDIISLCDDGSSVLRDSSVKETIQFEDVARFFNENNIQSVDLMKVNIEGGEYELLPRLFVAGLVNKIKHIQIQFHDVAVDSEDRMINICRDLSKTHIPTYQYKFVWENWVRRDTSMEPVSRENLL